MTPANSSMLTTNTVTGHSSAGSSSAAAAATSPILDRLITELQSDLGTSLSGHLSWAGGCEEQ